MIDVETSEDGKVVVWRFDRPAELNALNWDVAQHLREAMDNIPSTARAIIVTGRGRAFSAGGDFRFLEERAQIPFEENRETMLRFYQSFLAIRQVQIPIIAAINGPAVGAGFCFALACDVRIASTEAKMAANFVRVGIHPGMGATYFLPKIAGAAHASELLLTGRMFGAGEAQRLGLISRVVEHEQLMTTADSIAREMSKGSPQACRLTLKQCRMDDGLLAHLEREAEAQARCYTDPNYLEALRAIQQKRSPRWV